jgi:hypothetical protein
MQEISAIEADEHTLCNPPVNVVSPEPRRSPSRGSLLCGRDNASATEKAPPGRGSVNRVWGSSLPRCLIVQMRMSELGRHPRLRPVRNPDRLSGLLASSAARGATANGLADPASCNCRSRHAKYRPGHPRMRVLTGVILAALLVSACSGSRVEHVVPAWANPGPASHVGRKPSPDANSRAIAEPQPTAQPAVPQPAAQPAVRAPAAAHSPSEE